MKENKNKNKIKNCQYILAQPRWMTIKYIFYSTGDFFFPGLSMDGLPDFTTRSNESITRKVFFFFWVSNYAEGSYSVDFKIGNSRKRTHTISLGHHATTRKFRLGAQERVLPVSLKNPKN